MENKAGIVAHNLQIAAELRAIVEALRVAELPCLVLKGIPLIVRMGKGRGERRLLDNDILVRRRDVTAAVEVLRQAGYVPLGTRALERDLRVNFEHPMIRSEPAFGFLVCEVHWTAFPPSLFSVPESVLWTRSIELRVDGVSMRVFEPVLQLLHLASHVVQHELCEPRTLRVFARAWTRWHAEIDTSELTRLASEFGLSDVLQYLFAASQALNLSQAPWPRERSPSAALVTRLLPPGRLMESAGNDYPERYVRIMAAMALLPKAKALGYLLKRAFPKPDVPSEGRRSIARYYAGRPLRPILRSLGWRPNLRNGAAHRAGFDVGCERRRDR